VIWVNGEGKYLCRRDWTGQISLISFNNPVRSRNRQCEPTGRANARPMTGSAKQSSGRAGWVEPFAKPITIIQNMMGIASLNPSYALLDRFVASAFSLSHGGQVAFRNNEYNWLTAQWIGCGKPVDGSVEKPVHLPCRS
jgi:hypothetical protein